MLSSRNIKPTTMNYTSAMGSSIHQMVSLIMAAKPLDVIIGQPTAETMNKMLEQMAQMVTPVKTEEIRP
jgi:hypothetical protein